MKDFKAWLEAHGGSADKVMEVVCDMSPAFLAAVKEEFEESNITVDWFHVVQLLLMYASWNISSTNYPKQSGGQY